MLSIAGGSACGQLLLLLAAPLLARLYSPADFGGFAILTTLTAALAAVAAGRFELAIPLPEPDCEAHDLVAVGLLTALGTALIGTLVVAACRDPIGSAFDQPTLTGWLWLVPWTAAAMAAVQVLNQLAIRYRRYHAIGRRNFLQAAVTLLTQLGAGAAGLRAGGLVLGLGIGQAAGALSLLSGARRPDPGGKPTLARRHRLLRAAARYHRFPLMLAPSGLLNVLGLQLPVLLFAYYYGAEVAGWLGFTQRILTLPIALLGLAVAQVYLAELARVARTDSTRASQLFLRISLRLGLVAIAGGALIGLSAPTVFALVFGSAWTTSGVYAQALAIFTATQFVSSPLSQTMVVFGRQGLQLTWDVARAIVIVASVAGTALSGASALTAVWAFGLSAAAVYTAGWLLSLRVVTQARRHRPADTPEPALSALASGSRD